MELGIAGWLLLTLCFILVLLPPRWDPAIRLKEWNDYDEAKEIERLVRQDYRAKCKRIRKDGPTPCLCCQGTCVG